MLSRYARPEMTHIWDDDNKYQNWLTIETYALEAMAAEGGVPLKAFHALKTKGAFNAARIAEIEQEVKHDVIAFVTNVAENVGDMGRYVHQGLTSSDVLDTGFSMQLTQAADILLTDLTQLAENLQTQAQQYKFTPTMGRSHGVHAEPTTFGLKLAGYYSECQRHINRLAQARAEVAVCAISGPVGTYSSIAPTVEIHVAKQLGLAVEPVSTQVIPRDRHAHFFATLGGIAGLIERLATEIRHLQRTEVREVMEPFAKGQKGSSAMPHKKNPIGSENLTGLARLVRGYVTPAFENTALWHERDISHSSVERVIAPDSTITLDFALHRLSELIANMQVDAEKMHQNMEQSGGLHHSQQVLLALTHAGLSREDAYALVQQHALKVWQEGGHLHTRLQQDENIAAHLSQDELAACFASEIDKNNINHIFNRVFAASAASPTQQSA